MKEKPKGENDYIFHEQQRESAEPDWSVQDGALTAKPKADLAEYAQSWIYYQRPLCDRETLQYEFFYAPGTSATYPTIGRLAFLLEPGGVDLHWIGRGGWDDAVVGIPLDNRIAEAECRRGPAELPLKPNDWNQVVVTLKGDRAVIAVNGVAVYERQLEPENNRLVGLFRDKRQAAKVRAAALSGPWPEQFTAELQRDLIATSARPSDADRRLIGDLLSDTFAEHDAAAIVEQARSLPSEQHFDLLRQWVLPSPDHAQPRLYFSFAPAAAGSKAVADPLAHDGLICPAVEFIEVASLLNKLPELREQFGKLAAENDGARRCQLALLAIADIRQGDDEAARKSLVALHELVAKDTQKETPPRDRAPEFVAAWLAAERPALRYAALDLANRLLAIERDKATASGSDDWRRIVNTLVGRSESALSWPDQSERASDNAQWAEVADRSPEVRSQGSRPDRWHAIRGQVQYRPAAAASWLYFQTPLRGNFEIVGEHSTGDLKELLATYGGHAAVPRPGLKAKRIVTLPSGDREAAGELQIPNWGSMAGFRIAVDGTKVTTCTNGVQIHEEFITPKPSPWVALHASYVGNEGTIQDLRILGKPEIPTEIDLIDTMSAACWRADLYGESVALDGSNESAVSAPRG